ncbi:site-specific integrase [Halomonas sediminis]
MPSQNLTQTFVDRSNLCPKGKKKVDYFDSKLSGLLLKVLDTGRKTWYLRYSNAHGRIREKKLASATVVTLSDIREFARRHLSDIALGNDPFDAAEAMKAIPTLSVFINETYMPYIRSHKRSWKTDQILLRAHVLPNWGHLHLDEITQQRAIKLFADHRLTHKPASTNRVYDMLNTVFHLAIRWETGLTANPLKNVRRYKENNKRERYLTEGEAKQLFEALETTKAPQLRAIVTMLLLTGARLSEVLNAQWKDFDTQARVWTIEFNKSGKTRYVPLSNSAIQLIENMPRIEGCAYSFANPQTKEPYSSIHYAWDTVRKRAGLADLRIHDLRHSFASFLVNGGRSIYEVQKILGHTQIRTTQRYAHLSQETLLEAASTAMNSVPILASLPLAKAIEGRPTRPPRPAVITHSPPLLAPPRDLLGTM